MSRKDKRPESLKENQEMEGLSNKATDPTIFDEQGSGGQTRGHFEAGAEANQMQKGPGNFTGMGVHSNRQP